MLHDEVITENGHAQCIPAVLLGVIAGFLLPDRPGMTTYLNAGERDLAVDRMERDTSGGGGHVCGRCELFYTGREQFHQN